MKISQISKVSDACNYTESPVSHIFGGLYISASSTTPYAFTLRKVTDAHKSDKQDYINKFDKFKKMGIVISDYTFEKNHTNEGIHSHGVMQVPKSFSMKRFRTRGWHIHLDEIKDYAGWLSYITKESMLEQSWADSPRDPEFKMPTHRLFN